MQLQTKNAGSSIDSARLNDAIQNGAKGALLAAGALYRREAMARLKTGGRATGAAAVFRLYGQGADVVDAISTADEIAPKRLKSFALGLPSAPGASPNLAKSSSPLRALMLYAWDDNTKSVVIGPKRFPSAKAAGAPGTLEFGGSRTVKQRPVHGALGLRKAIAAGRVVYGVPLNHYRRGKQIFLTKSGNGHPGKGGRGGIVTVSKVLPVEVESRTFAVAPRPFMAPANETASASLAGFFRGAIGGNS